MTGGTGALGHAVLEALLARGAICHVPCIEKEVPARFELRAHPGVRAVPGVDLGDEQAVGRYYASLPSVWASVHLAGGFAMAKLGDTSLADLRAMLDLNLATCFLAAREAARRMAGTGGRIVNVAARPAVTPTAGMIAYAVSKGAVASLTQHMAAELVGEGILVNAVLPSIMDSPANRKAMPKADHDAWPRTSEVAEAIAFLASPRNTLTSGALIPVYGKA